MNPEDHDNAGASIGKSLLNHAAEAEFSARRGLIEDLFPYVYQASRRLSGRAISRFLEEEHGVKLSSVTISKAIREPRKYWLLFFDTIEPFARKLADTHDANLESLLFNENVFDHLCRTDEPPSKLNVGHAQGYDQALDEYCEARNVIEDKWYGMGPDLLKEAQDFLEDHIKKLDSNEE